MERRENIERYVAGVDVDVGALNSVGAARKGINAV
jgi:hypothetical protein